MSDIVIVGHNDSQIVMDTPLGYVRLSSVDAWFLSQELLKHCGELERELCQKHEREQQEKAAKIPVDRSARTLTDGSLVTEDHREINPVTGQQKAYVVLSATERAKGFVRPVRRTYVHIPCGVATTMCQSIAETYARDPQFYNATFCVHCKAHFPIGETGEFRWDDGTMVGT